MNTQNIYLLTYWFQVSIFWTFSPFFLQKEGVPLNEFDFTQKNFFWLFYAKATWNFFGILKKFSQFDGENQSGAAPRRILLILEPMG